MGAELLAKMTRRGTRRHLDLQNIIFYNMHQDLHYLLDLKTSMPARLVPPWGAASLAPLAAGPGSVACRPVGRTVMR